jgi:hypothetical protein
MVVTMALKSNGGPRKNGEKKVGDMMLYCDLE